MTNRSLVITILLFVSQILMAQNKKITGTIIDSETKNAICGAVVTMGNNKVITDIDGRFSIQPNNSHGTITCTFIGYKAINMNVSEGQSLGTIEMIIDAQRCSRMCFFNCESKTTKEIKKNDRDDDT